MATLDADAKISIHAPQWGATDGVRFVKADDKFQSTHPSGVRLLSRVLDKMDTIFQSTHPSGVRLGAATGRFRDRVFQSTHPSGVRPFACRVGERLVEISIHAPQWGATFYRGAVNDLHGISIHAPQWGATCPLDSGREGEDVFQSTHPSGVRRHRFRCRP